MMMMCESPTQRGGAALPTPWTAPASPAEPPRYAATEPQYRHAAAVEEEPRGGYAPPRTYPASAFPLPPLADSVLPMPATPHTDNNNTSTIWTPAQDDDDDWWAANGLLSPPGGGIGAPPMPGDPCEA